MLFSSGEANRSQAIHEHLAHAPKDVFTTYSDTTSELVGYLIGLTQRVPVPVPVPVPALGFEHDKVLAIFGQ